MTKLQNLTLFADDSLYSNRYLKFLETEFGQLYQSIPFKKLGKLLPSKKANVGAKTRLPPEGFFGLMFLKHYTNLSDSQLINHLNTNWAMQYFCSIQLSEDEMIKDKGMASRIRGFIAEHVDIEDVQKVLLDSWKDDMENLHVQLNDATAYESYIKFPTDVKLLWDCTCWVYETLHALHKTLGIRKPRSKYNDHKVAHLSYQKKRKKTYKMTLVRKRALLRLLKKGIGLLTPILKVAEENDIFISEKHTIQYIYIKEIYRQQQYMFDNRINKVSNRIVSLFKPYLRPIVRGKENKRVEFGAKVTMAQVDGINMIDKLSFDAYNEAKELKNSILKHRQRFGKISQIGIDQIYGTNENRKYMKGNKIFHSLVRKGKASKHEEQEKILRSELGKERSTVLEGSFGNEKNHYGLRKIKARTEATEIIWILFGVQTANAVKIAKRKAKKKRPPKIKVEQLSLAA